MHKTRMQRKLNRMIREQAAAKQAQLRPEEVAKRTAVNQRAKDREYPNPPRYREMPDRTKVKKLRNDIIGSLAYAASSLAINEHARLDK